MPCVGCGLIAARRLARGSGRRFASSACSRRCACAAAARLYIAAMSRRPADPSLDPRARQLLRTLIARYIRDGEPVGSQTLARHAGPGRERGDHPQHPGRPGGRRPAQRAAHLGRARADARRAIACSSTRCCRCGRCRRASWRACAASCRPGSGTQALLGSASELLSAMTHFVGVVSVPRREQFAFRHIDFVPLDGAARAGDPGVRRQRGAEPHRRRRAAPYDAGELERVANYLNAHFAGRTAGRHPRHAAARAAQRPDRDGDAAGAVGRAGRAGAGARAATTWCWPGRPG